MTQKNAASALAVAQLWLQPLRWLAVLSVCAYYHLAYRIRGWGGVLPRNRGPALLVINHQHEIETAVIVAALSVRSWSWRYPIFAVSSRRMFEPGFMAERIPWLNFALRRSKFGPLFGAIGLQPIENELHTRPFVGLASSLLERHGDLPLADVFRERALSRLPVGMKALSDLLSSAYFKPARGNASLSELREPYRSESLEMTRAQLDADSATFVRLVSDGATLFLAPEGRYSGDGKMQRLRGLLSKLAPLARIWLAGISYDPFVGWRLSMLYRVAPASGEAALDAQMKAVRPVTTSALLATWLRAKRGPFSVLDASDAIQQQLRELPGVLFVDPDLRRNPARMVRAALAGMIRLGMLRAAGSGLTLTERRAHPQFPRTTDMIAYQANFHEETLEGARIIELGA
jgi:1-acyl-sn-glycerol-3-phosphate acyltransferase